MSLYNNTKTINMKSIVSFFAAFSFMLMSFASCNAQKESSHSYVDKNSTEFIVDYQNNIDKAVLVDVRTPQEFNDGAIDDALNINFLAPGFLESFQQAVPDKDQPIYLYCKSGNRSSKAAQRLVKAGYTNVTNDMGGYQSLKKAQE